MTEPEEIQDHGEFLIHDPGEDAMVAQLSVDAQWNTKKKGEMWGRLLTSREVDGQTVQGVKLFHLDTHARRLTITETWGEVETARRTISLEEQPPSEPETCAPPDPGPDRPLFTRLPFREADIWSDDDTRDWLLRRAEQEVMGLSALPRRIRLLGDGFQEILSMPLPLAAGLAPATGSTLRALSKRHGVERRFVEGWLPGSKGSDQAWILELDDHGGWWLATRDFERRPGLMGVWSSPWSRREGSGVKELPEPLRPIVSPPKGELAIDPGEPVRPPPPDIRMAFGTLKEGDPSPVTAGEVAEKVGRSYERKMHTGVLSDGQAVVVFRGKEWETWELRGELPAETDEMLRAIAARGDPPTAMALVRLSIVPFQGDPYRALVTTGEAQGRRLTRAMLIRLSADGSITGHRIVAQDHGEVGDEGWIGVEPNTNFSLVTLDSAEA